MCVCLLELAMESTKEQELERRGGGGVESILIFLWHCHVARRKDNDDDGDLRKYMDSECTRIRIFSNWL